MKILRIKPYGILTNETSLHYTVFHTFVPQQITMEHVTEVIQLNHMDDNSGGVWIMWQPFQQVCSVGNF